MKHLLYIAVSSSFVWSVTDRIFNLFTYFAKIISPNQIKFLFIIDSVILYIPLIILPGLIYRYRGHVTEKQLWLFISLCLGTLMLVVEVAWPALTNLLFTLLLGLALSQLIFLFKIK